MLSQSQPGHKLHFDEDATFHNRDGRMVHPLYTALVYLSESVGGPTIVLNETRKVPQSCSEEGMQ
jgi:hypothetical protein